MGCKIHIKLLFHFHSVGKAKQQIHQKVNVYLIIEHVKRRVHIGDRSKIAYKEDNGLVGKQNVAYLGNDRMPMKVMSHMIEYAGHFCLFVTVLHMMSPKSCTLMIMISLTVLLSYLLDIWCARC